MRPEEDDNVRVVIQAQERIRQFSVNEDPRFDLLPVKVVGLRNGHIVANDADRFEGNRGQAYHVFIWAVEETAKAVKHAPKLADHSHVVIHKAETCT